MGIGSIGFTEILVIAVIVLIFFGPQRLPEVTRALGGAMREFRRSMNEIQRELEEVDRVRKWNTAATSPPAGTSPGAHATVPVDAVTPQHPEEMTGEAPAETAAEKAEPSVAPEPEPAVAPEPEPSVPEDDGPPREGTRESPAD